jgi:hypothetical protein
LQAKTFLVEDTARQSPLPAANRKDSWSGTVPGQWCDFLKITTNSLEYFQDGVLTLSPGGRKIFDVRAQSVLIIKAQGLTGTGFAGKYKLGANIELPGVLLSGNLEAFINTFGSDQTIEISPFLQPVVGFSSITISGKAPLLNPNYDPTNATSDILVPDTSGGAAARISPSLRVRTFNC